MKKRDLNKACDAHFSSRGHSVHDMKVSILEKVHSDDELLREERESMFIRDFKRDLNKACGAHFSLRGHTVHGMKISILGRGKKGNQCLSEILTESTKESTDRPN